MKSHYYEIQSDEYKIKIHIYEITIKIMRRKVRIKG